MKKTCAIIGIFVFTFIFAAGGFMSTDANAARICIKTLPCAIQNITCTQTPCTGTCYPGNGGLFYCAGDPTPYCSKDYYYPVPCM